MADISILGVDELLIIFSLLSIRDKVMAMRVCKNWHSIISRPQVWPVINFFDKQGGETESLKASYFHRFVVQGKKTTFEYRGINEALVDVHFELPLQFPPDSSKVSDFLTNYGGSSLKEVYLTANSFRIMNILCELCPNLKKICYMAFKDLSASRFFIDHEDSLKTLHFPRSLRTLFLQRPDFQVGKRFRNVYPGFRFNIPGPNEIDIISSVYDSPFLSLISEQCTELEELGLFGFYLNENGMMKIAENTTLKKIELLFCKTSDNNLADLDLILSASIGHLKQIQTLRLQVSEYQRLVLRSFFEQVSHWEHLKVLSLRGCFYNDDVFLMLLPALYNLQMLYLSGQCITSVVLSAIGKHLKRLSLLELENGSYSSEQLDSLAGHPSLKTLLLDISNQTDRLADFLIDVYELIRNLPHINFVRVKGEKLSQAFYCQKFYVVKDTVTIEVQDTDGKSGTRYMADKIRIIHETQGKIIV